jgi:hypothetical protein
MAQEGPHRHNCRVTIYLPREGTQFDASAQWNSFISKSHIQSVSKITAVHVNKLALCMAWFWMSRHSEQVSGGGGGGGGAPPKKTQQFCLTVTQGHPPNRTD